MAKRVKDSILDSATARRSLSPRRKPYYRRISNDLHLGYRRPKDRAQAGAWVMRRYLGDEKYSIANIGIADDIGTANGSNILTFDQAQDLVRAIEADRREVKAPDPFTVGRALDDYLARLASEHSKSLADAKNRSDNLIRPKLGDRLVSELSGDEITKWRNEIASRPRHVRGKKGQASRALAAPARPASWPAASIGPA